jgi:hypothetical protein
VNAQIAEAPSALMIRGVRGQLVQELTTHLTASEEVAPFIGMKGAHGVATISFEEAGTMVCIDATIEGFDPAVAHLVRRASGGSKKKGTKIFNFSTKRLAPGRFNGCGSLSQLALDGNFASVDTVASILHDPTAFCFHFHQAKGDSDNNHGIRGQLDDVIV